MERKEITKNLSILLESYLKIKDPRIYWAKEVTFNCGSTDQFRVDYMKIVPENNSISGIEQSKVYCYEIKSCENDFNSIHGHNFIGDYNYYIMPYDLYEKVKTKLPYNIGVLCPDNSSFQLQTFEYLKSVKKAHKQNRSKPLLEILFMMFRSYARDKNKEELYD